MHTNKDLQTVSNAIRPLLGSLCFARVIVFFWIVDLFLAMSAYILSSCTLMFGPNMVPYLQGSTCAAIKIHIPRSTQCWYVHYSNV